MDEAPQPIDRTMLADGLEAAFIGYSWSAYRPPLAIYDRRRAIRIIMEDGNMTADEADEYLHYNIECRWSGGGTPIFLNRCTLGEFVEWSQAD